MGRPQEEHHNQVVGDMCMKDMSVEDRSVEDRLVEDNLHMVVEVHAEELVDIHPAHAYMVQNMEHVQEGCMANRQGGIQAVLMLLIAWQDMRELHIVGCDRVRQLKGPLAACPLELHNA